MTKSVDVEVVSKKPFLQVRATRKPVNDCNGHYEKADKQYESDQHPFLHPERGFFFRQRRDSGCGVFYKVRLDVSTIYRDRHYLLLQADHSSQLLSGGREKSRSNGP